ncbi:MAG TPA: hypothetical protein VNE59_00645 [Burkholderiales bacterium]|nr:hypothetical protein [Burkholderiales bacterium]
MSAAEHRAARPFVPLLLIGLGFLVWTAFQTLQIGAARTALEAMIAAQEAPVTQAYKLRASLDRIAAATARLGASGDKDAQSIVLALKQRGVTINPGAASTPAAP